MLLILPVSEGRAQDLTLHPPRVVEPYAPPLPESHASLDLAPPVVALHVTVSAEGTVTDAHLEHSGDPELDAAALDAISRWRFAPATRGEAPIPARIRVEVHFDPPTAPSDPLEPSSALPSSPGPEVPRHPPNEHTPNRPPERNAAHPATAADEGETDGTRASSGPSARETSAASELDDEALPHFEAHAEADPIEESLSGRVASDYEVDREILEAAPHRDAADMLSSAPGVYVARPEGDAVAQHIFLRGFDAEHGQDIEMTMGGGAMPLNLPSHIHGQGYADLGFLIPEVIRSIHIREGVYDPRQGDFATAGSIDFDLGVTRRGTQLHASYGSFDTMRAVAVWAPEGESEETFGAATLTQTDGYGQNRYSLSGGSIAQWTIRAGPLSIRLHASVWGARASLAGFIKRDEIAAGAVDFYGTYDDPSARAQSALSLRGHLGAVLQLRNSDASFAELSTFVAWSNTRLQANYTGYFERSGTNTEWVGRGDLIEQQNEDTSLGLRARYRSARLEPIDWLHGFVEVGLQSRFDAIGQAQNLLSASQNEIWDRRLDADIRALDAGAYVDLDWHLTEYIRIRGGLRSDVLFYDVDDRLANFIPDERPDTYIMGYHRSAFGFNVAPRASVEVAPIEPLTLMLAYGEGFRSPQALQLQDGDRAPFARVQSGDLGAKLHLDEQGLLTVQASGYYTAVSDDTAFDPGEGRLQPIGPTSRIGGALALRTKPWEFLTGALSVTYTHASLDAPPRPTLADPSPLYRSGEALPFVPPWVVRADLAVEGEIARLGCQPLTFHGGLGFSFLSPRPLPYGLMADPVALLDLSARASWSALELRVEVLNVTDSRYAATEYSFASYWQTSEVPSRLPARHIAAGPPLTLRVGLGVRL